MLFLGSISLVSNISSKDITTSKISTVSELVQLCPNPTSLGQKLIANTASLLETNNNEHHDRGNI